jgi:hypothetical protein
MIIHNVKLWNQTKFECIIKNNNSCPILKFELKRVTKAARQREQRSANHTAWYTGLSSINHWLDADVLFRCRAATAFNPRVMELL